MSAGEPMSWHAGGCHCRAVRFEVALPAVAKASNCNCSICEMTGFIHLIVPEDRFRIVEGADRLTDYTFNTGVAHHLFCATCGIKSFYRPRSKPDGWSVNARCLDDPEVVKLDMSLFDGRNWEAHAAKLAQMSREAH